MQFEDFDKKVREAAEHHHPAYDEKAWKNMEHLLDKHLPVEKDNKRRIIFFLLIFLLAGTGAYLWFSRQNEPASLSDSSRQPIEQPVNADPSKADVAKAGSKTKQDLTVESPAAAVETTTPSTENQVSSPADELSTNTISGKSEEKKTQQLPAVKKYSSLSGNTSVLKQPGYISTKNKKKSGANSSSTALQNDDNNFTATKNSIDKLPSPKQPDPLESKTPLFSNSSDVANSSTTNPATNQKPAADTTGKKDDQPIAKQDDKKQDNNKPAKKKNQSTFAITVSGGPDVSTVGVNSFGKMNCVIGAGLSYTYNRFTVRAGFYAVKKVYTAGPEDYKPPKHYWTNYVNLTKVDANCKVYEIPITIGYNFVQKEDHSIFGAVGISSYLMKRENYEYYYKDSAGLDKQRSWSTKNNNTLFSVLNVSAGYEKKLARNLSLTVEPYLKVPLDGIGFGNIQMNSMGVLITMNIKPFIKK